MCGIAGEIATGGVDVAALEAMGEAIRHRGPDGLGYLLHGYEVAVYLFHALFYLW